MNYEHNHNIITMSWSQMFVVCHLSKILTVIARSTLSVVVRYYGLYNTDLNTLHSGNSRVLVGTKVINVPPSHQESYDSSGIEL